VETEAAALRTRAEQVALGESEATRRKGLAQADVIKATGSSEAEIIALKGGAEAEAMRKKADSFKEYNEAAVLQILLAALPEIAKAVAEPLSKTDRITLVSTGGDGVGASKLTADIARIMAELPAVVESLSGVDIRRLIDAIPGLKVGQRDTARKAGAREPFDFGEEDQSAPTLRTSTTFRSCPSEKGWHWHGTRPTASSRPVAAVRSAPSSCVSELMPS
jgi:flotillin